MFEPINNRLKAAGTTNCTTLTLSVVELTKAKAMELSQLYDYNMGIRMPGREMHFPFDVLTNILSRLPSTFIIRFQIVSKYWCYVIRASDVLNARPKNSLTTIQLTIGVAKGELTHFNFDDKGNTKKSVHNISTEGIFYYTLSNMVNGLVCAYGGKTVINFYLVNLTTYEKSMYSKREIKAVEVDYDHIILGFNPSTGLYKFVRIYSDSMMYSYYFEILEIGASFEGSWKFIGEISDVVIFENPVFLNGAIYLLRDPLTLYKGNPVAFNILKLDMKEDKFETLAPFVENELIQNEYGASCCVLDFSLSEENGKLYVLRCCSLKKYLSGWRLKESEGDEGVWNVMFHVNFASIADVVPWRYLGENDWVYVYGIVDGKVLIRSQTHDVGVYIYDLACKKLSFHPDVDCHNFCLGLGKRPLYYQKE